MLAIVLAVVSLIAQQPLALLMAVFATLIGLIPEIWYRRALRSLLVYQQIEPQHVVFGEEFSFTLRIENQKLLPLPWLKIECAVFPSLTVQYPLLLKRERLTFFSEEWAIWSLQRLTRYRQIRCLSRGCSLIGPLHLRSSDPFGWFEREMELPMAAGVIVYPLILPLEVLDLAWLRPLGDYVTTRRLLEDPLLLAGVRDYQIGDDPRHIHWKATARMRTLQSKLFEYTSSPRLLILLDTSNYSSAWLGADREMQELTMSVAASLALRGLDQDAQVGLLANGGIKQWFLDSIPFAHTPQNAHTSPAVISDKDNWQTGAIEATKVSPPGVFVPFSRHHNQYEALLSTLACLDATHHIPMPELIEQEDDVFRHGSTVILVSAANTLSSETVECLYDLSRQGINIYLVLIRDAQGKPVGETHNLPVAFVDSNLWQQVLEAVEKANYESIQPLQLRWDS